MGVDMITYLEPNKPTTAVLFCGHESPFGRAFLDPILNSRFEVLAVVLASQSRWRIFRENLIGPIQESRKPLSKIRKGISHPSKAVKYITHKFFQHPKRCKFVKSKIQVLVEDDIHNEIFLNKLLNMQPDIVFSAAYPQIFKEQLLNIPKIGAVNFHPSLLPKYRGAHPHFWVLYNGDNVTGITAHYMTTEIDAGDIIAQVKIPISENMKYKELYNVIINNVPQIVSIVEDKFFAGDYVGVPQENEMATYFRNDREIHHRIFWTYQSAQQIKNIVRASNDRAFFFWHGVKLFVTNVTVSSENRYIPNNTKIPNGTIVYFDNNGIVIKVRDAFINILEICINGKMISGRDLLSRIKPQIGEMIK